MGSDESAMDSRKERRFCRKRVAEIIGTPFVLQVYWDRKRDGVEMVRGYIHCQGCEGNAYACYAVTENEAQKKLETVISAWSKALNILGAGVCDENHL